MKKFELYEFAAVIVPGVLTIVGSILAIEPYRCFFAKRTIGAGEGLLILVLAYAIGHLTQAVGNLVEWVWWRAWGGPPTDWPRMAKRPLLGPLGQTVSQIFTRSLNDNLGISASAEPADRTKQAAISEADWRVIRRFQCAAVANNDRSSRGDALNATYGLFRGIAAAVLIVATVVFFAVSEHRVKIEAALLLTFVTALYRMHRFAVRYALEQYIQIMHCASMVTTIANENPDEGI